MSTASESPIWKEIDLSESYLVCGMFKEASSLAYSTIESIRATASTDGTNETQLAELLESAGMVFVQSMKELGRTSELFVELRVLFGSVAAIPVHVFITGACMQISEGFSSNLGPIFEEFLGMWKYFDDEVYVYPKEQPKNLLPVECSQHSFLHVDKYLEVAEVYAITLLGTILHIPGIAISWTERAELPEDKRQDMLRRLHSLQLAKAKTSLSGPETSQLAEKSRRVSASAASGGEGLPRTVEGQPYSSGDVSKSLDSKSFQSLVDHISDRFSPCFWWFRVVNLKFGHAHLVLPRAKIILLGSFVAFAYYFLRKRRAVIKRIVASQAANIRRALVDAWHLAFSVQVNPLAAVQPLPPAPRPSR